MMFLATNALSKHTFMLSTQVCWLCERKIDNPLISILYTTMQGPKGLVIYEIMESPEEIYQRIEGGTKEEASIKPASVVAS